ncbi:unnamed protein product [Prorocentrum cordatum]|uniref:Uncharacterized protein n=1 Tax=Prorocentrum cordatum TaxID=2364126 RepID=A0ABN9RZL0_9DINO|nr:unnamed protein product [Polarella glacialis]
MGEAEVCNLAEGKGQFSERLDVLLGNVKNGSLRLRISCMQPQPGAALRHCSIPLLCIEEVRLSSSNTLEILTKLADQIFLRFDDARLAALAFKKLSDSPSVVVAGSPFSFAFCFAAVLASSPAHELQGEQPQGAPPASTFHEAVDGPQSDQDSDPYSFSLVAELQRWTRAHDGAGEQWRVDSTLNNTVCARHIPAR